MYQNMHWDINHSHKHITTSRKKLKRQTTSRRFTRKQASLTYSMIWVMTYLHLRTNTWRSANHRLNTTDQGWDVHFYLPSDL